MTVNTVTPRIVHYTGNGVDDEFPLTFTAVSDTDLVVINTVIATGVETEWVLNSDYSVVGSDVIATVPPASGTRLTIYSSIPVTQETDYIENGEVTTDTIEAALDKLTYIVQEQKDVESNILRLSATLVDVSASFPSPGAGKYIRWNGLGTELEAVDVVVSGSLTLPGGAGLVAYDGTTNLLNRTLTGTSNQISVTNGTGASGNPTISLPSTLIVPGYIGTSNEGLVRFYDADGSNYIGLKSPATVSSNLTFSLPSTDGSSGQVLKTNGSGVLSFGDAIPATPTASVLTLGTTSDFLNERVLTAGSGVSLTDAGAGSTLTVALNVNGLTTDSSPDSSADYLLTYDSSASAHKKVLISSVAQSGAQVLIATQTSSGGTNLQFTSGLSSTAYSHFILVTDGLLCTNSTGSSQEVRLLYSTNGGGSYTNSTDFLISITAGTSDTIAFNLNIVGKLAGSTAKLVWGETVGISTARSEYRGTLNTSSTINAIMIEGQGVNLTFSGSVYLYGVLK